MDIRTNWNHNVCVGENSIDWIWTYHKWKIVKMYCVCEPLFEFLSRIALWNLRVLKLDYYMGNQPLLHDVTIRNILKCVPYFFLYFWEFWRRSYKDIETLMRSWFEKATSGVLASFIRLCIHSSDGKYSFPQFFA